MTDQPFLEATKVQPIGLAWDDFSIIHGIVGLAPSSNGSTVNNPSPFKSMVDQKQLDKNIFGMRLRKPREIAFGGINDDLFTGDFVHVPLTNKTGPYILNGTWQTEANYVALGDSTDTDARKSLDGYTAAFSLTTQFIHLPDLIVLEFWNSLGFRDEMFVPPVVDCDQLGGMPDMTFNLAGQDFTLSPWDYTLEWPLEGEDVSCVSAFMPFGVNQTTEMVLGSAFLRAFYSVFDLEEGSIGCEFTFHL